MSESQAAGSSSNLLHKPKEKDRFQPSVSAKPSTDSDKNIVMVDCVKFLNGGFSFQKLGVGLVANYHNHEMSGRIFLEKIISQHFRMSCVTKTESRSRLLKRRDSRCHGAAVHVNERRRQAENSTITSLRVRSDLLQTCSATRRQQTIGAFTHLRDN